MSKRVQTTNLNLYAYENLRELPTFLQDWSDNMLILDGAYVTVNGLISALDTRLTSAEGTLEDLSPESIEDYKVRLDALEKKVVINTNAIKDVNTRIGTINAQINSINVEQGVQNSRLTALEGVTANHTSQINSIIGNISSVTDRVTTLEQCCETVQHEIADMQSDIDGFNDDLTVLATQFETVSGVVSELTDLVNSLQLDVVSQRLDTFESDLDALTASVTSLSGRMTDAENQIELNGNAINENALDIASIESEMGNTDYSEVGNTVSSAIVELADRIRNLTPQEYDTLVQAIQNAEQEIDDIQALIPDDATSSNKLITLNDVVIPSVNIASASRAGIIKVGQRLSVQNDGTLDADNQIGDSSYGLVKSVNDIQALIPDDATSSNKLTTIADISGLGGITVDTLWTNPNNPSQGYPVGRISIPNMHDYKFLIIKYRRHTSNSYNKIEIYSVPTETEQYIVEGFIGGNSNTNTSVLAFRKLSIYGSPTVNEIEFFNGNGPLSGNMVNLNYSVSTSYFIPLDIYGIK